jgi:hypothetical protein
LYRSVDPWFALVLSKHILVMAICIGSASQKPKVLGYSPGFPDRACNFKTAKKKQIPVK